MFCEVLPLKYGICARLSVEYMGYRSDYFEAQVESVEYVADRVEIHQRFSEN